MALVLTIDARSTSSSGQLSTAGTHVRIIELHARAGNLGKIVVGISTVTSANGRELSPDERVTWNFSNLGDDNEPGYLTLSDLFVHITNGGDVLDWTIFIARD